MPDEKIRKTVGVYQSSEPARKRPSAVILVIIGVLIAVALIVYYLISAR